MELGEPITTEQAAWAIVDEIHSPIVGNLRVYSHVYMALDYCQDSKIYRNLSSGEQRLVDIAVGVYSANPNFKGSGVAILGGLDRTLRRKVWVILGYLYLGRDLRLGEIDMDFPPINV